MKEKISQLIRGSKEEEAAKDKQPEKEVPPPPYQEYDEGDSQAPPQAIPSYGEKTRKKGIKKDTMDNHSRLDMIMHHKDTPRARGILRVRDTVTHPKGTKVGNMTPCKTPM